MEDIKQEKEIIIKGLNGTQVAVVNALVEEIKKQIKPFNYQRSLAKDYITKYEPRLKALKKVSHSKALVGDWIKEIELELEKNKKIVEDTTYNINYVEKKIKDIYSHIKETITETQAIFEYETNYFTSLLDIAILFTDIRIEE